MNYQEVLKMKHNDRFSLSMLKPDKKLPDGGYMSYSRLSMYLSCPKKFEYRYVKKMIAPTSVNLAEGSAVHSAVEFDNIIKIYHGRQGVLEEIIEAYEYAWNRKKQEVSKSEWVKSEETPDIVFTRDMALLKAYVGGSSNNIVPSIDPEFKLEVIISGVPFLMFIDCIENERIIDYKTVSRKKSKWEIDNDIQLTLYSMAIGISRVAFCQFLKVKVPYVHIEESFRTTKDYAKTEDIVRDVVDAICKGSFPRSNPSESFPCSPQYCGYWDICKKQ